MIRVGWHPLASREIFEASEFYDGESPGLGGMFLNEVENALERLKLHPRAGWEDLPEIRRYLIARFPYNIVYRIEEQQPSDRILVLAIAHNKRKPRYWARRL